MRFLKHFFAALAGLMAAVGAINYLIDPFDLWSAPLIAGVNTAKSVGNVVYVKPLQVEMRDPGTVLLGSSRVQVGLDPDDFPAAEHVYNFGVGAVKASEMRAFAEHVFANTRASKLVLGLDFFSFNDTPKPAGLSPVRQAVLGPAALWRAAPVLLFSQAALERSRHTVADSRKKSVGDNRSNGFLVLRVDAKRDPGSLFMAEVARFVRDDYTYGDFRSFDRSIEDYRALLAEARAKGITVVSYISPVHAVFAEAVERMGLWPTYKAWERRLVEVSEAAGVPLWDFSGYNEFTTTPLKDGLKTHFDGSHFRPEIGRLVIARLYGAADPAGFGVRLGPETIEAHLAEIETARTRYREDRADDVAAVAATVAAARQPPHETGPLSAGEHRQ